MTLTDSDEEARRLIKKRGLCGMRDVYGSPRTFLKLLRKHADLGVDEFRFYFMPFPNINSTKLFVKEVIPELG